MENLEQFSHDRSASERFRQIKGTIVEVWKDRLRREIPAAKAQSNKQLRNSIPKFMDKLCEALSPDTFRPVSYLEVNEVSQFHGEQRAGLVGYSLDQMLKEYQILREVIFRCLEKEGPISVAERDIILSSIELGMAEASRFYELLSHKEERASRTIPEGIRDHAIIRTDTEGRILDWNSGAVKLFGWEKREVLGKSAVLIFTPEDVARKTDEEEKALAARDGKAEDKRWHIRKDGTRFFANGILNSLEDDQGTIFGYIKVLRDDTNTSRIEAERKQAQEAIQRSEEQFRSLANSLPQIIWTSTPEGHVDWYNDWWYAYLDLPRDTQWDDSKTSPMHPEDVKKTWPLWRESLNTGKPFYMEQRFRRGSDGQYRWHLVRGVAIRDNEDKIIKWVGANTDIHDHKDLVEKLEEERELRERFVAALSHDLRTPITSAKLSAQSLRRAYSGDEKIQRTSDRVVSNLDRVDSMIQDLLDASRLSAGEKIPVYLSACELSDVVFTTVEELRHIHGNRFIISEDAGKIQGHWDCSGFRRILENLCTNAIKYGDAIHPITIRIGYGPEGSAFFSVHNEGKEISSEDITQLFEPYTRAPDAQRSGQRGWGIGLMLVKGVVDAHGGSIEVTSTKDSGTTFLIRLPVRN